MEEVQTQAKTLDMALDRNPCGSFDPAHTRLGYLGVLGHSELRSRSGDPQTGGGTETIHESRF
jgi:hypothetical protein